ncbi:TenA family protein [Haematobacter genomosp. 1]|uniref:Thiaminase II n=1 Tax=Haematobacter genomosp. 1 TaxID=366618 RepID=A0A212A5Y7_9RHOB|nr:TenA family protein [Haematobacter genomosp. 1]OWJ74323.1 thiaminase II [Haematobacter genomosp. 1]
MSYGHLFPRLRSAAGPVWPAYVGHPFVTSLGEGSLPRDAFLGYLVQDYLFLRHFSRAWALAVTKAETLEEMRYAAAAVHALLNDEMALHVRLCARVGIGEDALESAEERLETLAYTRFVMDAGHMGDFLDLLVALAPCVMGYGEIGLRLRSGGAGGPYAEWIETYGGDAYQALCHDVGRLMDSAAARRIGAPVEDSPRWPSLAGRFRVATVLETRFWDMGLAMGDLAAPAEA